VTYFYYKANPTYYGPRDVLSNTPTEKETYKNIIWIIDESVTAKHLSINGFGRNTTPYLESIKQNYVNFGVASSAANCSAASNLILMSGIQVDQLPDSDNYSLKAPSIFQYAKNAGYKTHYISGQSYGDLLQNNMTPYDLKSIDNFYQPSKSYKEEQKPENDIIIKTEAALGSNDKNFIYIVKRGAHFEWKYPLNKNHFKPSLDKGDIFELKNKEKAVNSYINLVKYRTDDFFKHFFDKTKLLNNKEALIIYTSDHGQSIFENNKTGTHCDSTEPNPNQGNVPLLVFASKHKEEFGVLGKDKFSHFEIFPTTLKLMGYEAPKGGKTFFNKTGDEQIFFSGDLFGRSTANLNPIAAAK
jgi:glucan phosphoethanolaminetransferase (alkaline phosphatase superfamily)